MIERSIILRYLHTHDASLLHHDHNYRHLLPVAVGRVLKRVGCRPVAGGAASTSCS